MRPFEEARTWARRAPAPERAVTAAVGAVVAVLVGALLVPGSDPAPEQATSAPPPSEVSAGGGAAATSDSGAPAAPGEAPPAAPDTTGQAPAAGTDAGPAPSASGGTATASGCTSPPGSARGVTADEVRIAIALTEIVGPAANQVFNVASPEVQRANFEAILDGINGEGGAACRRVVARYVTANPADEGQMIRLCRDLAGQEVFAVVDTGALGSRPAVLGCLGQAKLPYFGALYIPEGLRRQFFPYVFSLYTKEQLYRTSAFALREVGFFDAGKGFQKLGFIFKSCNPASIDAYRRWLGEAGVRDDRLVAYDVGCPSAFANPADLQQAVLTFRREGVSHVTAAEFQGDLPRFTSIAEQQRFRPRYGFPDENIISLASGTLAPDPENMIDAIAITTGRDAENRTPGMAPTPGTARCDGYLRARSLAPTWAQDETAGNSCNQLWMLRSALDGAPALDATSLPAGLQRARSIDFAYPQGPNDFSGEGVTTGGQFWRTAQFSRACRCWQVVQRDFRRGF